ncbi:hypothetical protein ACFYTF_29200 [Nocardia thailandica]|uniref:Uncharacterized protein n=1 Tax=Nocardia thailandica TaxID=257275 RepID=A0ABW6PWV9_9NOCA
MTQTPRPTPPPPPITAAVYLPATAPLPADPTPAARRWCADVAEAESLGHAALVLRYAHALSALRAVWRSRSRRIAAAAPRVITTAAEADTLPVGTILVHVDCPNPYPYPCIWRRACSPSEVEDEIDGGTYDHIHWAAWGDEDERYDGADLEGHADCGGPLLAVYVPTEES